MGLGGKDSDRLPRAVVWDGARRWWKRPWVLVLLSLGLGLAAASWVGYEPVVKWWKTRQGVSILQEALQVARGIAGEGRRSEALRDVAEAMAQAGKFEEALQVAQGIEDARTRAEALVKLAEVVLGGARRARKPIISQNLVLPG